MKRIAIVTGASSGMGKEFALTVEKHGTYDEIWCIARNEERLLELQNSIKTKVRAISLDLAEDNAIKTFNALLDEEKPDIAMLVNCAGYGIFNSIEGTDYKNNMGMIDLNVRALTGITLSALPYMKSGAEIINFASVAAFQPIPYINIYGATKAYVLSFSRALNRELKQRGIRVFAVCPYWTKTAFFARAISDEANPVVKKYAAMYEPKYIVDYAWSKLEHTKRDYCIPGFKAKAQVLLVKLLPHRLVMTVWQKQQKLK